VIERIEEQVPMVGNVGAGIQDGGDLREGILEHACRGGDGGAIDRGVGDEGRVGKVGLHSPTLAFAGERGQAPAGRVA